MKINLLQENVVIPSEHQHGDKVVLDFGPSGSVANCTITKVAFTGSQTWYDVEVEIFHSDGGKNTLRLHNINAAYVYSDKRVEPAEYQKGDQVWVNLWATSIASQIYAVHQHTGKIKYCVIVNGRTSDNGEPVKLDNIDAMHVSKIHPDYKAAN